MKLSGRWLIVYTIALIAFIQGAYGIQITASGGGNGESGSVAMNFDTLKSTAVSSQIAINGADITPSTAIAGPIAEFKQTHWVKDASGKSASVYVKVLNAPSGLTYTSKVLPSEGNVATQTQVSAEQWLTVPKADSIKCTAISSYGTLSANVGLEEAKNALVAGDYVTLTGYYGKALTTGTSVLASQTATSGAANSIKMYGTAKDSSGTYKVDTWLNDMAIFTGLSGTSSAGTTTQVVQTEHVHGTFTSTATFTPTTGTAKTKTRTSNYGTEYDLNMKVAKGSLPTGTVGYYVKPGTIASKIQGAVNAAQSGDTINVAAGTYKENVKIDKSLAVKGAGSTKTIVDGNKAGSVFAIGKINPYVNVALFGMKIQNGAATYGGGIYNSGRTTVTGSTITGNSATKNGGGIYNSGTVTLKDDTISGNSAPSGADIASSGTVVLNSALGSLLPGSYSKTVTVNSGAKIQEGINLVSGGGTVNVAAGTYKENVKIDKSLSLKGAGSTKTIVDGNKAGSVFAIGKLNRNIDVVLSGMTIQGGTGTIIGGNKYNLCGGGILNYGRLTVTGSTISGNVIPVNVFPETPNEWRLYWGGYGGGIYNAGTLTVTGSTISKNEANGGDGGGIYNSGTATVTSSTVSENAAPDYLSPPYANGERFQLRGDGSGIYNAGTLAVTGSTISKNVAKGMGGGIYNTDTGVATVTGSTISGNAAGSSMGWYYGGGIFNNGKLVVQGATRISGNKASRGGGIDNSGGKGKATVIGSTISENTAFTAGGICNSNTGRLEVTGSTISKNAANFDGGGISNFNGGTAIVTSSIISENTAELFDGGGISNAGTLTVTGSTISKNAAYRGGGISNNYGNSKVTNSIISGNTAQQNGGGIYISGSTMEVTGSTITENIAASNGRYSYGGGIHISDFLDSPGTLTLTSSTISKNIANYGGGISLFGGGNLIVGGTSQVINNQAIPYVQSDGWKTGGYGGGIFSNDDGTVKFDGTKVGVKFNKAHRPDTLPVGTPWYKGWGVYLTDPDTYIPPPPGGFNPATQVTGNTHI